MDTSKLIGKSVKHVTYGSGKIAAINDKYIKIIFDRGELKRFQFPQVFVSYLKIEDASLMSEILMEEQKRIMADQRKKRAYKYKNFGEVGGSKRARWFT